MVAKQQRSHKTYLRSYLLAKIHMVAKRSFVGICKTLGYLLAKIHMVAKHSMQESWHPIGYLLAKIHMVAKLSSVKPSR